MIDEANTQTTTNTKQPFSQPHVYRVAHSGERRRDSSGFYSMMNVALWCGASMAVDYLSITSIKFAVVYSSQPVPVTFAVNRP